MLGASPAWSFGTFFGAIAGNILPMRLVSAFSVALYGMFIAIIVPAAKADKIILSLVIISFVLSYIFSFDFFHISEGIKTIILTVIISALGAIFFPLKNGDNDE